jgi:MoxR-like ATPase
MAITINSALRLIKRLVLANLKMPKGLAVTPMVSGPHGIGKSQIVTKAAEQLGGYALVTEGGSLKEGEITGLPFITKISEARKLFLEEYLNKESILKESLPVINSYVESLANVKDAEMRTALKNSFADKIVQDIYEDRKKNSEVRFTKYYLVKTFERLERHYYELATTKGLLGGKIKISEGKLLVDGKVFKTKSDIEKLIDGEENIFSILNELPADLKMKLLESGEIKPILLFIDELNRTEPQTMKELMNIILNRGVNGYTFPWFVTVISAVNPSSQSSIYSVNELDDAQRDRFLRLSVDADINEWIDYALAKGLDSDAIAAIATNEEIFVHRSKDQVAEEQMDPSPRSWEMVSYIYSSIHEINETKFFSSEEKKSVNDDLKKLIKGKVGSVAGDVFIGSMENKELNIKPSEIINGKSDKIDEKIVKKFTTQKPIRQKITMENVVFYIAKTVVDFENKKKSTKADEKREYVNYKAQIKQFVEMLPPTTKLAFAKKMAQVDVVVAADGKNVFGKISDCFAEGVLAELREFEIGLKNLENN